MGIITSNRPERRNAVSLELLIYLYDCIDEVSRDGKDLLDILAEFPKPIIEAVNLYAITGGLELPLNRDFLIA